MRWFKHDTDMHTDLKIQSLMDKFHGDGYTIWCLCLELLGKEGKNGTLTEKTMWKICVQKLVFWLKDSELEAILSYMSFLGLICPKSLRNGTLHVKKFDERADNWTKRLLHSNSVVTTAIDVDVDKDIYMEEKKHLLTYFCGKYQERFNRKYVPSYAKDYSLLKNILGTLSEKEVISLMDKFFATNDPFVLKEGFTIGIFKSQINKLQMVKDGVGVWGSELK